MTADWRELVTWIIGTTLGLAAIAGLLVRWVLMPYLREHLLAPLQKVSHELSNGHRSDPPTAKDSIGTIESKVDALADEVRGVRDENRHLRDEQRRTRSDVLDLTTEVRDLVRSHGEHVQDAESWSAEVESRLGGLHWPSLGRQRKP